MNISKIFTDSLWLFRVRLTAIACRVDLSHLSDEELLRRRAMANIRATFSAFGLPNASDEQINQGLQRLGEALRSFGQTVK